MFEPSLFRRPFLRPSRSIPALIFAALLFLVSACDRGTHPSQTGKPAPDFTVSDAATTVRLADYRGKIVVLNFWATWCAPCIEELPSLIAMQRQTPQVVVLAISTDEDDAAYRQFLKDNHIDLITVRDARQLSNHLYGSIRFPETYVIDRNGILRRKFIGAQNWTSPEILKYLRGL